MKVILYLLLCLITPKLIAQTITVVDSTAQIPVSFATISFGNGLGTFAGEDGVFAFTPEKYKDIDTLYISAIGYQEKVIAVTHLPKKVYLLQETSQLSEVVISVPKRGKFKIRKRKPTTHVDHFASWLPTVESEVAVLLQRQEGKSTQISKLWLPINAEAKYKSNGKGKYATFFRIQFYKNEDGFPGAPITHDKIVFAINEEEDKTFELDIIDHVIFIPENGIFVSLQVLGYADKEGKLIQSKKYREIKTRRGIEKISTAFRPLLPFSNQLDNQNTYVRRVFLNNKKWQVFDKTYNKNSKLILTGHRNYGLGAEFRVYEE